MADGLAGHEHEFYRYVANSTWIGRTEEYSTLDEAWPYWINGIVPLAYSLDDERLKAKVKESIDYIFDHQQSDGWIGPETTPQRRLFWPRTLVLYAVTQYLEAEPSQAAFIIPKLYKFMELSRTMLADDYLGYISRNDRCVPHFGPVSESYVNHAVHLITIGESQSLKTCWYLYNGCMIIIQRGMRSCYLKL